MKLALLLSILLSASVSFARIGNLSCSSGEFGEDNYFSITIDQDTISFDPYETHYTLPRSEAVQDGDTIAIVNKTVTGSAEGDDFTAQVSALMVYDAEKNRLNLTLIMDGSLQTPSHYFKCK